jgi:hypothetical protein
MTNYPYILFNKSPEQLRRLGARGGRAHGCNQRARRAQMSKPLPTAPMRVARRETTAQAIAVLDAQFPWLRGAEKRRSGSQPSCPADGDSHGREAETFWSSPDGRNRSVC